MVPITHIPDAVVMARTHQRFWPKILVANHSKCCTSIMGDANNVAVATSGHSTNVLVVFQMLVVMGCQNTSASKHPAVTMFAIFFAFLFVGVEVLGCQNRPPPLRLFAVEGLKSLRIL